MSIDGFYVPLKLQQQYGFESSECECIYRDVDVIVTNASGYSKLRTIELSFGKSVYIIKKDMTLTSHSNKTENKPLTIEELEERNNGVTLIVGNDRKLISSLFHKSWIDEITICLFPVLLGKGKRLFPSLLNRSKWNVKGRQLYDSGITAIHLNKI